MLFRPGRHHFGKDAGLACTTPNNSALILQLTLSAKEASCEPGGVLVKEDIEPGPGFSVGAFGSMLSLVLAVLAPGRPV